MKPLSIDVSRKKRKSNHSVPSPYSARKTPIYNHSTTSANSSSSGGTFPILIPTPSGETTTQIARFLYSIPTSQFNLPLTPALSPDKTRGYIIARSSIEQGGGRRQSLLLVVPRKTGAVPTCATPTSSTMDSLLAAAGAGVDGGGVDGVGVEGGGDTHIQPWRPFDVRDCTIIGKGDEEI